LASEKRGRTALENPKEREKMPTIRWGRKKIGTSK